MPTMLRSLAPERPREPDHERADKPRQEEHRPRRTREGIAVNIRGLRLRPEEQTLLAETGRFRVLAVKDIVQTIYGGDKRARKPIFDFWKTAIDSGSIQSPPVMTAAGFAPSASKCDPHQVRERLAHETGKFPLEQKLYHGLVKPREVEHDTQIYRAYLKEAGQIERAGGKNLRVELDFELKQKSKKQSTPPAKPNLNGTLTRSSRKLPNDSNCPYP